MPAVASAHSHSITTCFGVFCIDALQGAALDSRVESVGTVGEHLLPRLTHEGGGVLIDCTPENPSRRSPNKNVCLTGTPRATTSIPLDVSGVFRPLVGVFSQSDLQQHHGVR